MNFGQIATSAIGAISGAFSGFGARKRQKEAIAAQQKENELARAFNRSMAEQANKWARENVADERAYNTPAAQMKRLKEAGLNPDLMYGNGASGLVDSNVASTFQTSSYQPSDMASPIMNTPLMSQSILNGISASKMLAETQNIQQDTAKKKGETTSLDLDNLVKAATQGSTIELANMQVSVSKSVIELNSAQKENLLQGLKNLETANNKMNAEIEQLTASARNLDTVSANNRLEALLKGKRFALEVQRVRQELQESDSRIKVNESQIKRAMLLMLSEKMNLDMNTLAQKANVHLTNIKAENAVYEQDVIKFTGRQLDFNYNQDMKFSDIQRTLETARIVSDGVSNVIGSLNPLTKLLAPAPAPIRGFGR